MDEKQKSENEILLETELEILRKETARTFTISRPAAFILAVLSILGAFFLAGLIGGVVKI